MHNDLKTLASQLRTLLDEEGPAALQAALEDQTATLPTDQRVYLERMIFGAESPVTAFPLEDAAAPSGSATVNDGNLGTIIQGAYNRIEQLGTLIGGDQIKGDKIDGDKVAGDKFQIDQLTLVVYTGPVQEHDPQQDHLSLEQAYRSEVVARYAVWRSRYAPLPIQATEIALPTAAAR